jgi:8-oxo-dGTP diphosphatase
MWFVLLKITVRYYWEKKASGVGPYPGCWLMPGGGVDMNGESIDMAMKREVKEETNLDVTTFQRLYFDEDEADRHGELMHLIFLYYKITDVTDWNIVKPGDDLVLIDWFSSEQLQSLQMPPISLKTYRKLGYIK